MSIVGALAAVAIASAIAPATCKIYGYGIFRDAHSIELEDLTTLVKARLGLRFGVIHLFENVPPGDKIELILHHPPLPQKRGPPITTSRIYRDPVSLGSDFGFDERGELVAGTWTFEFLHRGRVLCKQEFDVVVGK